MIRAVSGVDRDPLGAGDVEGFAGQAGASAGQEVGLDDVGDVGEVARLLAVAVDRRAPRP